MGVKIVRKDRGYGALLKRFTGSPKEELTFGVHDDVGSEISDDEELTISDVACIQEFGGPENNPPERSWLRDWFDENRVKNEEALRKLMEAVLTGKIKTRRQALELLGIKGVASIKERIIKGIPPKQADRTVENKGSSTPLVDSGQFIDSISFKIE